MVQMGEVRRRIRLRLEVQELDRPVYHLVYLPGRILRVRLQARQQPAQRLQETVAS